MAFERAGTGQKRYLHCKLKLHFGLFHLISNANLTLTSYMRYVIHITIAMIKGYPYFHFKYLNIGTEGAP